MKLIFTILLTASALVSMAQGYELKLRATDAPPQKVRLAYYYEEKQYLVTDSAPSEKGYYVFKGNQQLPAGIYSIILDGSGQYFDLLIDGNNQNFVMKCSANDPQKTMKITGSDVNAKFFDYQRRMTELVRQQRELDTAKKYEKDSAKIEQLDLKLSKIDRQYEQAWQNEAAANPNTILADVLNGLNATNYPGDSMFHYINFAQPGLLRSPFFYKCIRAHIARHIEDGAHEIMRQTDRIIAMSKANFEVYRYVSFYLLSFYRTFYKLGMNEVFVHIADNYFLSDTVKTLTAETRKMIEDQRNIYRSAMIGYDAHNFSARHTGTDDTINIFDYAGNKPILLMFWANGCGHCDSAENAIKYYYSGLMRNGYQVYTLCNDDFSYESIKANSERKNFPWIDLCDTKNMSRFREYYYVVSTPIMYLIDDKRRIVAKLVGEDRISQALQQLSL